jgi:drug/metabolite transporter (DMT)-like permease
VSSSRHGVRLGTSSCIGRAPRRTTVEAVTDDHQRRRLLGVALAVVSASSFGVMPVLTKVAYEDGTEPVAVLLIRFSLASLVLLALSRLRRERLPRGRTLGALLALGGLGYVGMSLCYFFALERVSAGLTALLLYFHPALVVVLAGLLLRQRPRPLAIGCVVLATLGTVLTIGPVQGGQATGVLLGLSAALLYATYIVISSRVQGVPPLAMAGVVLLGAAVVIASLAALTRPQLPSAAGAWAALAGVALLGGALAVTTFFAAITLLGPADASVVSTVEPVVSIGVAALVLGERLGPVQVAGGAIVLLAVAILARLRPAGSEVTVPA